MHINTTITEIEVKDVRFPTSLQLDGSDAMHKDPDYSAAYVIIKTDHIKQLEGHGLTFTIGRGNELCVHAIKLLTKQLIGQNLQDIFNDMGQFWHQLTNDSQLRWIGPEKGVIHLATGAIVNAMWDLFAKAENKPLWQLIADMPAEQLVNCIDFNYISDAITKEEALAILKKNQPFKAERIAHLKENGYPAYNTSVGWLGYSDDKIKAHFERALKEGWNTFKMKVGADLKDDKRRATLIRNLIGKDANLMMDANQRWCVQEAIDWMNELKEFNPLWIEEPTSPDDILGHKTIKNGLKDIPIATGEHCHNRIMFKQFMQAGAIDYCQIDACRVGGVNEVLSILFMAAKYNIPVCPHGGGLGLCEYVQHFAFIDYICISGQIEDRWVEYVDHLHQHFEDPVTIKNAAYQLSSKAGFSIQMKRNSLLDYTYPTGDIWKGLTVKKSDKSKIAI